MNTKQAWTGEIKSHNRNSRIAINAISSMAFLTLSYFHLHCTSTSESKTFFMVYIFNMNYNGRMDIQCGKSNAFTVVGGAS